MYQKNQNSQNLEAAKQELALHIQNRQKIKQMCKSKADLGLADNLVKTSGVAISQHIGNDLFKAPECYQPSDYSFYYEQYKKKGLTLDTKPTPKSESFALGKHQEINVFDSFNYKN
ncbi:hypothetical protein ABPG72_014037 [Tetrahymena utriculariae]